MNKNLKKYIGLTLRDIRRSKLYTVSDVSSKTNLSIDTIYRYEQGRAKEIDTLSTMLDFYDVPFNIFFKKTYDKKHSMEG